MVVRSAGWAAGLWAATLLPGVADAAIAQAPPAAPRLADRIVDEADLLTPAREAALASKLADVQARRGDRIVLITVRSLGGRRIEDVAADWRNGWGPNRDGNGVLLIVAPNERAVRIDFGLGLRQDLTKGETARITNQILLPAFQRGAFEAGVAAGTDAIIAALDGASRPARTP